MLPLLACTAALLAEPAATSAPPTSTPPAAEQAQLEYLVRVDVGPELARRMGVRVIVRPTGESFGNRRSAVALELTRPLAAEQPPTPASLRLPAGVWRIEASAPGYLPSTREFKVDAQNPDQTLRWPLLPDSTHSDVSFPVTADGAPGVTLSVRSDDGATTWSCTSRRTPCTLRLARGDWTVEARASGHRTSRVKFQVAKEPTHTVPVALVPGADDLSPAPGLKRPVPSDSRRLALGLGIASAPVFAAGVGLTLAGRLQYVAALTGEACDGAYDPPCANAVIGPVRRASAGVGLIGVATGLLATGITAAYPVSRTTWWIELGIGGALTVAGAGWTIANTVSLDRALQSGPLPEVAARGDRRLGASVLLGLGAGATFGAITGLLVRRRAGAITPYAAPGQAGLVWRGRF